jgi:hypothetical protein
MQDGAPPHFANSVREWLDTKFPGRWLGRRGPHEWPARSPDLTLCDFFLWGWAKDKVHRTKPRPLEELESRILDVITNVPHNVLRKTGFNPGRLKKLMDVTGVYIEFWYASVFLFKDVHIKLISINLYCKYRIYNPISMPSYFPPTL